MVADTLSRPAAAAVAAGAEWVCAAVADKAPLDLRDMALRQNLCPQVQALRSSPGLLIIAQKVGDLDLLGDSSTGTFRPLYPETSGVRFLNTSTGPPTLAGGRPAASSPPGMCGKVSPLT